MKWKVKKTTLSFARGQGASIQYEDLFCPHCNYRLEADDYKFDDNNCVIIPVRCPKCNAKIEV